MANSRHYVVFSEVGFDGTTQAPVSSAANDPWLPSDGNTHQKYRSLNTEGPIGRFSPRALGRSTKHSALVRVFADNPDVTDTYSTAGSATEIVDGLLAADPQGVAREVPIPLTTRPSGAQALELGPTDDLVVVAENRGAIHIIVVDLDEDEDYTQALHTMEVAANEGPYTTLFVLAPDTLDPWDGTLFVAAAAEFVGDAITLPPRIAVPLGARLLLWNNGTLFLRVAADGGDLINSGVDDISLGGQGALVTIEATGAGWSSSVTPVEAESMNIIGSGIIPAPSHKYTHVNWRTNGNNVLQLPLTTEVPIGFEFVITLDDASQQTAAWNYVQPQNAAGEYLNGQLTSSGRIALPILRLGDAIRVIRTSAGFIGTSTTNELDRRCEPVTSDPGIGAAIYSGLRAYLLDYAAPGDFTLPTAPKNGAEVLLTRLTANAVTAQAGINRIIRAGVAPAASLVIPLNDPVHLKFFGTSPTAYWLAV